MSPQKHLKVSWITPLKSVLGHILGGTYTVLSSHTAMPVKSLQKRLILLAWPAAAERKLLTEQAERSGKPANIIERMVAGRLHKVQ